MSTSDSSRLVQVCVARERWRLPWGGRRWRGGTGAFQGRGTGGALDFEDHRPYAPGDDLRHLNWLVYGRTGVHTLKVFRPEVSPVMDVVVDVSASMALTPAKQQCARALLEWAVESGRAEGAAVRVWGCGVTGVSPLALGGLSTWDWETAEGTHSGPPAWERVPWRTGGMRVFISDLLWPGDPGPAMDFMARGAGQAVIFSPFDWEESEPGWEGNVDLRDCESSQRRVICIDAAVQQAYRAAYAAHFRLWEEAAHQRQVALARIPGLDGEMDFSESLGRFGWPAGAVEEAVR